MKRQSEISKLMNSIFGPDAIQAGAICEQLEDANFCKAHMMDHTKGGQQREKWEELQQKAEMLADGDDTFTVENMRKFQIAVNEAIKKNPGMRLYQGLTEVEHYAARKFYYYNSH